MESAGFDRANFGQKIVRVNHFENSESLDNTKREWGMPIISNRSPLLHRLLSLWQWSAWI